MHSSPPRPPLVLLRARALRLIIAIPCAQSARTMAQYSYGGIGTPPKQSSASEIRR